MWVHLKCNNADIWPKVPQVLWPGSINHTIKQLVFHSMTFKGVQRDFFLQQNRPWQQNCKFCCCTYCYTPVIITVIISVCPNLQDEPEHLGLKLHTLREMKSLYEFTANTISGVFWHQKIQLSLQQSFLKALNTWLPLKPMYLKCPNADNKYGFKFKKLSYRVTEVSFFLFLIPHWREALWISIWASGSPLM